MKVQSRFIAFVKCFGPLHGAEEQLGEVGLSVGVWEKRDRVSGQRKGRGRVRKRGGWIQRQWKPESKEGNRWCSLFLNTERFYGAAYCCGSLNTLGNTVSWDLGNVRHQVFCSSLASLMVLGGPGLVEVVMERRLCSSLPPSPASPSVKGPFPNNPWAWRDDLDGKIKVEAHKILLYIDILQCSGA